MNDAAAPGTSPTADVMAQLKEAMQSIGSGTTDPDRRRAAATLGELVRTDDANLAQFAKRHLPGRSVDDDALKELRDLVHGVARLVALQGRAPAAGNLVGSLRSVLMAQLDELEKASADAALLPPPAAAEMASSAPAVVGMPLLHDAAVRPAPMHAMPSYLISTAAPPIAPPPMAPTPVAPMQVAPTPVAPMQVAPMPVAPMQVAPAPIAPAPVASMALGSTLIAPSPVPSHVTPDQPASLPHGGTPFSALAEGTARPDELVRQVGPSPASPPPGAVAPIARAWPSPPAPPSSPDLDDDDDDGGGTRVNHASAFLAPQAALPFEAPPPSMRVVPTAVATEQFANLSETAEMRPVNAQGPSAPPVPQLPAHLALIDRDGHAVFTALLHVYPNREADICARYGVFNRQERLLLDNYWYARLARYPSESGAWMSLRDRYILHYRGAR